MAFGKEGADDGLLKMEVGGRSDLSWLVRNSMYNVQNKILSLTVNSGTFEASGLFAEIAGSFAMKGGDIAAGSTAVKCGNESVTISGGSIKSSGDVALFANADNVKLSASDCMLVAKDGANPIALGSIVTAADVEITSGQFSAPCSRRIRSCLMHGQPLPMIKRSKWSRAVLRM